PVLYGGQAIIEGVMIRGQSRAALAVRRPDGIIVRRSIPLEGWANSSLRNIALVRGVLVLLETLLVGMKSLTISANEATADEDPEQDQQLSGLAMATLLTVSLLLGIVIFFLIPVLFSRFFEINGANNFVANLVEGGIRLGLFIGYVWVIGKMDDIKRVFGYHGAEHMVVHAHEAKEPLTVESVRRFPPAHPRCGTSFLMTVVLVSIIMFMLFPRDPMWFLIASRIVLVPVIAGISYEFIRYAGTHQNNIWIRLFNSPNILLQDLTTRQPDEGMMEVAITAIEYAIAMDEDRAVPSDDATELSSEPFVPVETTGASSLEYDDEVPPGV
ncbi:MAG TPA: DUF1385 domain-containing protein, partial [Dehalococcoidia bacterium]|nr:DUF1385 domain-containing protein [Dehalococcoidia bacterium]